jgi:hypothetical protein
MAVSPPAIIAIYLRLFKKYFCFKTFTIVIRHPKQ